MNTNVTKYIFPQNYFYLDCVDTASWVNGYGYGCTSYGELSWCENGAAKTGSEWTLGSKFNYPENNCCVCGKGQTQGNVIPLHYYNDPALINIRNRVSTTSYIFFVISAPETATTTQRTTTPTTTTSSTTTTAATTTTTETTTEATTTGTYIHVLKFCQKSK